MAKATLSYTVILSMRRKSWNMTPSVRRRKGSLRRFMRIMSKPLTVISPLAAWTSPVSSFMMVVLPEPEGPTRNTNSPSWMSRSTPCSASVPLLS